MTPIQRPAIHCLIIVLTVCVAACGTGETCGPGSNPLLCSLPETTDAGGARGGGGGTAGVGDGLAGAGGGGTAGSPAPAPSPYLDAERKIFDMLRLHAIDGTSLDASGAVALAGPTSFTLGQAGIYFGDLAIEGARPADWIADARVSLIQIADEILALQAGSPASSAHANEPVDSLNYGAIGDATGTIEAGGAEPSPSSLAGRALLRAYHVTGDRRYLDGAIRVGQYLRATQRCDALAGTYCSDSTGGRLELGGWPSGTKFGRPGTLANPFFETGHIAAMSLLAELRAVVGGSYVLGLAHASGDFAEPTTGTIDDMIAEAREFYATPKIVDSVTGVRIAPMSAATPQTWFESYIATPTGVVNDGKFQVIYGPRAEPQVGISPYQATQISSLEFTEGLAGLFDCDGYSPAVRSIFEWLMAFSSDPQFAPMPGEDVTTTLHGSYAPSVLGLTEYLAVLDTAGHTAALNGSAEYYFSATAAIASVYSAAGVSLAPFVAAISQPRPLAANKSTIVDINVAGQSGLGLQASEAGVPWIYQTAIIGGVYRGR